MQTSGEHKDDASSSRFHAAVRHERGTDGDSRRRSLDDGFASAEIGGESGVNLISIVKL